MRTRSAAAARGRLSGILGLGLCIGLASMLSGPAPAAEQQGTATWYHIIVVNAKTDRVADFEALAKQMNEATAAAKLPEAEIYEVAAGEGPSYHVAIPMQALAEIDSGRPAMDPAAMSRWEQRIASTVGSLRNLYIRSVGSYGMDEGLNQPLVLLRTVTVKPGKEAQFVGWINSELLPALEKARAPTAIFYSVFGDSANNFYFVSPVAKWADFDKPGRLEAFLGEKGMDKLLSKIEDIVDGHFITLLQSRPDLRAE